jgi:hypothetical protein
MERGVWGERLKKSFHFKYKNKDYQLKILQSFEDFIGLKNDIK